MIVIQGFFHLAQLVMGEAKGCESAGDVGIDREALFIKRNCLFEVFVLAVAVCEVQQDALVG